jgi:hypothetical protein
MGVFMASGTQPWIGYDDLDVENTFTWVNHSTSPYTNWTGGQPNDNGNDEDCATMKPDTANDWDDLNCGSARASICECETGYVAPLPRACRIASGWTTLDGRRYMLLPTSASGSGAEAACAASGAYLFTPADMYENGDLTRGAPNGLGLNGNNPWIGLVFPGSNTGSKAGWIWLNGSTSPFANWTVSQPDAASTHTCVFAANGQTWSNNDCTSLRQGVCECDPDPPTP